MQQFHVYASEVVHYLIIVHHIKCTGKIYAATTPQILNWMQTASYEWLANDVATYYSVTMNVCVCAFWFVFQIRIVREQVSPVAMHAQQVSFSIVLAALVLFAVCRHRYRPSPSSSLLAVVGCTLQTEIIFCLFHSISTMGILFRFHS